MPNAVAVKVLVVDDQNSVRQMTRMTLEELGFKHIHEAENGVQAMETASLQPLDLIISDYNMPEMDGLGLLRAVRGHPVVRKVPIILLTGRGDRELDDKAEQAGHRCHPAREDRAGHGQAVVTYRIERPRKRL